MVDVDVCVEHIEVAPEMDVANSSLTKILITENHIGILTQKVVVVVYFL